MNFGMVRLNQSMVIEQNYVKLILIALLFTLKLKIFNEDIADDVERVWYMVDTSGLIHLPMMRMMKDRFQQVWTKKAIGFFKDKLGGENMKEFCGGIRNGWWQWKEKN